MYGWCTPPTQYDVYLYDGLLHYTFVAVREDVPDKLYNKTHTDINADPDWVRTSYHDVATYYAPSGDSDYRNPYYWPSSQGLGMPYYGLCTKIEDKFGHAVNISYVPATRDNSFDDPSTSCVECWQLALRKGQISHIELTTPSSISGTAPIVHWTLVYSHRHIPYYKGNLLIPPYSYYDATNERKERASQYFGTSVIDRIYVYKGDAIPGSLKSTLRVESDDLPISTYAEYMASGNDTEAADPIRHFNASSPTDLPTNWVHQVHYWYSTMITSPHEQGFSRTESWSWQAADTTPTTPLYLNDRPSLIRSEVITREQDPVTGHGVPETEHGYDRCFRYLEQADAYEANYRFKWLDRMYTSDDIARLKLWAMNYLNQDPAPPPSEEKTLAERLKEATPLEFSLAGYATGYGDRLSEYGWSTNLSEMLDNYASFVMNPVSDYATSGLTDEWPTPADTYPFVPSNADLFDTYLNGEIAITENKAYFWDSKGARSAVSNCTVFEGEKQRHYRIFRLYVMPDVLAQNWMVSPTPPYKVWKSEDEWWSKNQVNQSLGAMTANDTYYPFPGRSIFVHPYRFVAYPSVELNATFQAVADVPDLTRPRYIVFVDEFEDRMSMMDPSEGKHYGHMQCSGFADPHTAVKPGQMNRRLVALSASGYPLLDKTWEFDSCGRITNVQGGSLGESYLYSTVGNQFSGITTEVENLVDDVLLSDPTVAGGVKFVAAQEQVQMFLGQQLLVQHRSVGWSAAKLDPAINEDTNGLVQFSEYAWFGAATQTPESVPLHARVQVKAQGVQKGSGATAQRVYARSLFHNPVVPTDLLGSVEYLTNEAGITPDTQLPAIGASVDPTQKAVIHHVVVRDLSGPEDATESPVVLQQTILPPRQLRPGSALYYPIQAQFFDAQTGASTWSCSGMVVDALHPVSLGSGDLQTLAWSYSNTKDGNVEYTVADASAGLTTTVTLESGSSLAQIQLPAYPTINGFQWSRLPTGHDCLDYVTYTRYANGEAVDIFFPNGRRWSKRNVYLEGTDQPDPVGQYKVEPGSNPWDPWSTTSPLVDPEARLKRVYVFNDLERRGTGGGEWYPLTAGEVKDYEERDIPIVWRYQGIKLHSTTYETRTSLLRARRVEFAGYENVPGQGNVEKEVNVSGFLNDPSQLSQPFFRALLEVQYKPDQYGKLADIDMFDYHADGTQVPLGSIQVNDLGEMYRERTIDATVTRIVKNPLGQALRKYVGTEDFAWTQAAGGPIPGYSATNNDMVLTERYQIGAGVHDGWLRTHVWRYSKAYLGGNNWELNPWGDPPIPDNDGQLTRTKYDWRMRPVRVEVYSGGVESIGSRSSTTVTHFDNADRARIVATYAAGAEVPAAVDPTQAMPTDGVPAASTFLVAAVKPTSLTETIYSADGKVSERREYDVTSSGAYLSEFTYSGFGDRAVMHIRPGSGAEVSVIDGVGRVASTATVSTVSSAGLVQYDKELARTDYTYDADNNVKHTVRWERVGTAGNMLDATNAVWSMTLNWYDAERRLIATADRGANADSANADFATQANIAPDYPQGWVNYDNHSTYPSIDPVATSNRISRGTSNGIPPHIPLTIYHFDRKGNQDYVAVGRSTGDGLAVDDSDYTVTRFKYTGSGKIDTKIEDPFGTPRTTRYQYRFGRLSQVILVDIPTPTTPPGLAQTPNQYTLLEFGANPYNHGGAEVVDINAADAAGGSSNTGVISQHGAHVSAMHLLSQAPLNTKDEFEQGAVAPPNPSILLRYDFQGRICERIDARGIAMRYRYDELDRLKSIEVGHYAAGNPDQFISGNPSDPNAPTDRIGFIQFSYAADNRTYDAKAFATRADSTSPTALPITHNRFEFNTRGDLVKDWQSLGAVIDTSPTNASPFTSYTWDYAPTTTNGPNGSGWLTSTGYHRLSAMYYPDPPGAWGARSVNFTYGVSNSDDSALSRITLISSVPGVTNAVKFGYIGSNRRSSFTRGNDLIVQDFGLQTSGNIGLTSLDAWGRMRDLHYKQSSITGTSLTRFEYNYDQSGNRLTEKRTPRPVAGTGANDYREQLNSYDVFDRLTVSDVNQKIGTNPVTDFANDTWALDQLGNWLSRSSVLPGSTVTREQSPSFKNEILQLETTSGGGSPTLLTPEYDPAGNLVWDGRWIYKYDAWNRLVQANADANPSNTTKEVGSMAKHWTYDSVGRLVRVQSPWPVGSGQLRSERLYYDGVRRVQELVTDPVANTSQAASGGEPAAQQALSQQPNLSGSSTVAGSEANQLAGTGGTGLPPGMTLAREYLWGPGDRGVDELLVQYDPTRTASYPIQDAGGDIVAHYDKTPTANTARLLWRGTYDAYGRVIESHKALASHAFLHAGHKGLFFDRVDGSIVDPVTLNENPRLIGPNEGGASAPNGSELLGHARNRTLHTGFGRWLQRDPNATGMQLSDQANYHGSSPIPSITGLDLSSHFRDGVDVFSALRINPYRYKDALGLWGGFLLTEEFYINNAAAGLGALEAIKYQLMRALVSNYGKMLIGTEMAVGIGMGDAGTGLGPAGIGGPAAVELMEQIAKLGGKHAAGLVAEAGGRFSEDLFRYNFGVLTGMAGKSYANLFKAHHIVPKRHGDILWSLFKIDVNNPLFGQWMLESEHVFLHNHTLYDKMWDDFVRDLVSAQPSDGDAILMTIDFIKNKIAPTFKFQVVF